MRKVFGTKTDSGCIKIGQNMVLFRYIILITKVLFFWHKNSAVFTSRLML